MKSWAHLLLCLLLSFGIWLIYNLSQDYTALVGVDIIAESSIEGRSDVSSSEVHVDVNCRSTGFRIARLNMQRRRPVRVFFDPSDLQYEKGDEFSIPQAAFHRYVPVIFGDGVTVDAVVSGNVSFRFAAQNCKKVPVRAVKTVSYRSQYMPAGPMTTVPDSVMVYGDPARLESIDAVMTRPINLGEVRSSVHGTARLEAPSGVRLAFGEVTYQLDVSRFVEIHSTSAVGRRNVPAGHDLSVFPSTVDVTFCCAFPVVADPSSAQFYVDYREFASSMSGACVVRFDHLPEGVLSVKVDPQVCECVENQPL